MSDELIWCDWIKWIWYDWIKWRWWGPYVQYCGVPYSVNHLIAQLHNDYPVWLTGKTSFNLTGGYLYSSLQHSGKIESTNGICTAVHILSVQLRQTWLQPHLHIDIQSMCAYALHHLLSYRLTDHLELYQYYSKMLRQWYALHHLLVNRLPNIAHNMSKTLDS